jgi:hypothetical protein
VWSTWPSPRCPYTRAIPFSPRGSGKTAAFGLDLRKLGRREAGPAVSVLAGGEPMNRQLVTATERGETAHLPVWLVEREKGLEPSTSTLARDLGKHQKLAKPIA